MKLIVKYFFFTFYFWGGCLIRLELSCIWVNMVYNCIEFPSDEDRALLQCPIYSMLMIEGLFWCGYSLTFFIIYFNTFSAVPYCFTKKKVFCFKGVHISKYVKCISTFLYVTLNHIEKLFAFFFFFFVCNFNCRSNGR
jgi:hypothetical protein